MSLSQGIDCILGSHRPNSESSQKLASAKNLIFEIASRVSKASNLVWWGQKFCIPAFCFRTDHYAKGTKCLRFRIWLRENPFISLRTWQAGRGQGQVLRFQRFLLDFDISDICLSPPYHSASLHLFEHRFFRLLFLQFDFSIFLRWCRTWCELLRDRQNKERGFGKESVPLFVQAPLSHNTHKKCHTCSMYPKIGSVSHYAESSLYIAVVLYV